jgi:NAD(P) transhydrogenase subunit alpha
VFLELYVFLLAGFLGFLLISRIPPVLHTPLMSATNAIHGIILVGAILLAANAKGTAELALAFLALVLASMNVVGGFAVTDRMLALFRDRSSTPPRGGPAA